ncbi:MAG TPA: ABC transporter permease [Candidatus Omnitrophota bacterium]|nr:ABC transporter permease [Candidatus Omnitrophota bacterium]
MFDRIRHILKKEFLQIIRDPKMRIVIFAMPLFQVIVFGLAVSLDVKDIKMAVYDLDDTPESREVIRDFAYSRYFDIVKYINTDAEEKELIDTSRVTAVLHFKRGFGADINAGRKADLQIVIDGTDSNTAGVVLQYASKIVGKFSLSVIGKNFAAMYPDGIPMYDLRVRAWFNENLESRNFLIPGIVALIVMIVTIILTAMAVVREKEMGTIEQLMVSPIRSYELILGKLIPFGVIGMIDVVAVTILVVAVFHVPVRGNIVLLLVSSVLYLLTTLGVGLYISTRAKTQQEAVMSTFFFVQPAVLLSGFVFPIANMPVVIQYCTFLNPLRYYVDIVRGIFLKGIGFNILWPHMLALLIIGVAIITMSAMRFKKRVD